LQHVGFWPKFSRFIQNWIRMLTSISGLSI